MSAESPAPRPAFRVTFLGSGNTWCDGGRANQAVLLEVAGKRLLVDCGPTTVMSAKRLGVDLSVLDAIFLTHRHGDHTFGLPQLLLELQFMVQRTAALPIFVPPGSESIVDAALELAYPDVFARGLDFDYPVAAMPPGGDGTHVGDCAVRAFEMAHSVPANGYRFSHRHHVVAVSGDTMPCDGLVELAYGADLLITECSYALPIPHVAHTSHEELLALQDKLECKHIAVVHTDGSLATEPFDAPEDGDVIELF